MTSPAPTPRPALPGHAELSDCAVRFLDALLTSADVETIGAMAWWDTARTALETAAASSTRYSEMVATAARKLRISGALSAASSREITALGLVLGDDQAFGAWRELAQSDAVYITALTRMVRKDRQSARNPETTR